MLNFILLVYIPKCIADMSAQPKFQHFLLKSRERQNNFFQNPEKSLSVSTRGPTFQI